MQVLVTGAAGSIGRVVTGGLRALGHQVVGFDRTAAPDGTDVPWQVGDCAEPAEVDAVFAAHPGLDAVVHLAGYPDEQNLPDSLTSHVTTTAALLDAMVAHGVGRIAYASSNHAVGRTPHAGFTPDSPMGVDVRPRPDTFYGLGKVAAEGLLSLYADRYGISALACRIGSFDTEPSAPRHLATWLSHDDAVRMFDAAITTDEPGFAVLYGISNNTRAWWDLSAGRKLGYEPQDDAELFADRFGGEPTSASDDAENPDAHVGGPFTSAQYQRPALST